MEKYLHEKGFCEEVIAATVERLLQAEYLDDEEFARMWLRDRERFRPRGARALRYEMRQKGIEHAVIERVLVNLDEDESAWTAVQPQLAKWQTLDEQTFKRKIIGFLSRRGFNYETVRTVCERAQERQEDRR
jgi:regulatory protein